MLRFASRQSGAHNDLFPARKNLALGIFGPTEGSATTKRNPRFQTNRTRWPQTHIVARANPSA